MERHLHAILPLATTLLIAPLFPSADAGICRDRCGSIPIRHPLGVDDGCGSPYYRNMLICTDNTTLRLRTPSGTYPVVHADYADPHVVVADPSMWTCSRPFTAVRAAPFSLDTSTRLSLSSRNEYLFFDCDEGRVIVEPRPALCDRDPGRCDSACDSAGYLCRNLPGCRGALEEGNMSCCTYRPRAAESLQMMLRHCEAYTSVYWREAGEEFPPYDQVPEYGIRVDFEVPVTTRCLQCQDMRSGGGGTCGFDPATRQFVCICDGGRNSTTDCADGRAPRYQTSAGVIAASIVASISGTIGIGGLAWYIRKMKSTKVVTCGVQSNENRFF